MNHKHFLLVIISLPICLNSMTEQKQKPRTFLNTMTTLLVVGVAVCSAPNTQALTICGHEVTHPSELQDAYRLPSCRQPIIEEGKVKVCVKHFKQKEVYKKHTTTITKSVDLRQMLMNTQLAGVIFNRTPAWKYDKNEPTVFNEHEVIRKFVKYMAKLFERKNVQDFIVQTVPDTEREKQFNVTDENLIAPGQCSDMLYLYDYKKKYVNSPE